MTESFKNTEDADPKLGKVFPIASKLYDLFESQLQAVGMQPVRERERIATTRWTMYIGTLFAENYLASIHISVLEMPRAQTILNRQLFEYFIRNQWLLLHGKEAADLLDSLPKIVQGEVERSAVFDDQTATAIHEQYEDWVKTSPLGTSKIKEKSVKSMVKELCQGDFNREFFYLYSLPSLIAHARPHGITDVLKVVGPNQLERSPNSVWFNRIDALNHSIGLIFQYSSLLAGHFGLDLQALNVLHHNFAEILIELGQTPELVAIKYKP